MNKINKIGPILTRITVWMTRSSLTSIVVRTVRLCCCSNDDSLCNFFLETSAIKFGAWTGGYAWLDSVAGAHSPPIHWNNERTVIINLMKIFQNVRRSLGTILKSINYVHDESSRRINSGNVCHYSVFQWVWEVFFLRGKNINCMFLETRLGKYVAWRKVKWQSKFRMLHNEDS